MSKKEKFCKLCKKSMGESNGVHRIRNSTTGELVYDGEGICGVCSRKVWDKYCL